MTDHQRGPSAEPRADPHLRAHIGFFLDDAGDATPHGHLPIGPRITHRDGTLSLGAIATMVDVVGMRAVGHDGPMVTSHLALQVGGRPSGTGLRARGRSARRGRSGGTSVVYVSDDAGTDVGVATLTGAALGDGGGTHVKRSDGTDDFFVRWPTPAGGPGPDALIGFEPVGAPSGLRYVTPFDELLRNVNGVLHGGAACLLVEQSGRRAATEVGGGDVAFAGLEVHFLAPGLTGPFVTQVEVVPADGDHRAFVVDVFDAGRDDRRIALGVLTGHAIADIAEA